MPEAFEDARVGVLMDVNQRLARIEEIARQGGIEGSYGSGWTDVRGDDPQHNPVHATNILNRYPDVWYDVIRANLMVATGATDRQMLESVAVQVAALATAWAADLRQRATTN